MRKAFLLLLCFSFFAQLKAQKSSDYYYEIPDYPASYTATTVAARVVDGLGFRFYWASVGLRAEDLSFKPTDVSRTTDETIDHIYNLTLIVMNATKKVPTTFPVEIPEVTYEEKREMILGFIRTASDNLKKASAEDMESFKMIFSSANGDTEYPFWNELNGPLSDALWHTGQVVMLRRMSGNPFTSNVSVLSGKVRN